MKPHKEITNAEGVYLRRWHIIPRNRWINLYLHHFVGDDDARALHDHPWWSVSFILSGGYWDVLPRAMMVKRRRFEIVPRRPAAAHRVQLIKNRDGSKRTAWTLFLTGPRVREWGFHCPQGWRRWQDFVDPNDPNRIGPGCD